MKHIQIENLTKVFETKIKRDKKQITAVDEISFSVEKGERLAFIGPNGAGKSTTIKMLTGILYPTSGKATVAGFNPWEDRQKLAFKIGTVFGQKSQLSFHLPARDSFRLFARIYELDDKDYKLLRTKSPQFSPS